MDTFKIDVYSDSNDENEILYSETRESGDPEAAILESIAAFFSELANDGYIVRRAKIEIDGLVGTLATDNEDRANGFDTSTFRATVL